MQTTKSEVLASAAGFAAAGLAASQAAGQAASAMKDVSERDWQGGEHKDLQWWRAKGAGTLGHYVTLTPGDVIYTGTPTTTRKMSPGDVVEVDIEGIGVLRNKVVAG